MTVFGITECQEGELAMMKYAKHIVSVILLTTALFMGAVFVAAEENGEAFPDWVLENAQLGHRDVSFVFSGFLPAKEARAVISSSSDVPEEERTEIAIDFTIEDGQKEYDLSLPEGSYLEAG